MGKEDMFLGDSDHEEACLVKLSVFFNDRSYLITYYDFISK